MPWLTEPVRAWIYRVLLALMAVGVVYRVIDANEAVTWGALAAALVGNGLATVNTTTKNGVK